MELRRTVYQERIGLPEEDRFASNGVLNKELSFLMDDKGSLLQFQSRDLI